MFPASRCLAALPVLAGCLWPHSLRAQDAKARIPLVQGGADTVHDAQGIAIGMPCADAIAIANAISARATAPRVTSGGKVASSVGDRGGARYRFLYERWTVPILLHRDLTLYDQITFACLNGSGRVFEITRQMNFDKATVGKPPTIDKLREMFIAKYGPPSVEYAPYRFATFYGPQGRTAARDACGPYDSSGLYLHQLPASHLATCTYALSIIGTLSAQDANSLQSVTITIRDYLRVFREAKGAANDADARVPTVTPKL